ncbi:MAG TPA: UvrD-helicase domain-containing protein [Longimicrobiales bacterium]|nr:UvrD-helicase domain-containing protein [Longimicrobiales bacterium]
MSDTQHLAGLNSAQRAAVTHIDGPLLILAGAGTGKTKTLVHRMTHLIRSANVPPARILAVTFTNRAAEEMRERVHGYVGKEARAIALGTFHALGVRILREHGTRLGLPQRFAIYATGDQLATLRSAASEISIGDDRFDHKRILWRISDWKSKRIGPEQAKRIVAEEQATGTRADDYAVLAADAYPRYEETLRAAGAIDFDDLLLLPVQLLDQDEEVRRALWKRWHHVMIDEYQDTNSVQFEMARLLAGTRRNLCVVGDDDQSIYAFRGADVGNILEFERHFPGARVVTLEDNYRSTARILGAANAIIAANRHRHQKRLRSTSGIGAPLTLHEFEDELMEAEGVADEITRRRLLHRMKWGDIAVLYRANAQSRPLEEAFRRKNIPYRVIGGVSFFERKEVADATAYLRAVAWPHDEVSLRRIINYPTRGIGRQTVLRIAERAREQRTSFVSTLAHAGAGDVGAPAARAIQSFLALVEEARASLLQAEAAAAARPPQAGEQTPLADWAQQLFERIGLEDSLRTEYRDPKQAQMRVDNVRDLVGAITRYERRIWAERLGEVLEADRLTDDEHWAPPTLHDALGRLALADMDEKDDDSERTDDRSVALMTMHSAKGLEFRDVFIVGVEEGILPHTRSLDDAEESGTDALSEERRLFYVGVTRARERLSLSWCRSRRRAGSAYEVLPSRYLEEIPPELCERISPHIERAPEESQAIRENFFASMKKMFAEEPDA